MPGHSLCIVHVPAWGWGWGLGSGRHDAYHSGALVQPRTEAQWEGVGAKSGGKVDVVGPSWGSGRKVGVPWWWEAAAAFLGAHGILAGRGD